MGGLLGGLCFRKPLIVKMPNSTRADPHTHSLPPQQLYQPSGVFETNQCNDKERIREPNQPESRLSHMNRGSLSPRSEIYERGSTGLGCGGTCFSDVRMVLCSSFGEQRCAITTCKSCEGQQVYFRRRSATTMARPPIDATIAISPPF